ncbi:MAG: Asp-tRNA(Asn)/Glu-tRNA(Gln) amidotransferase GatCAB subunit C [Phycisphaerae bacterium]|nr:Asp-tRNA(Asn)/Glu-tRNA(Gln) amidotransferase GatCAB subunit C [Phycisphaerae bacterium]
MELGPDQIRHVAKLSRLELDPGKVSEYSRQLGLILKHIAKLNELDVDGVEPMAHPLPLTNRLADDIPSAPMPVEDLLMNAPEVEGAYLAVPKVLDEGGA